MCASQNRRHFISHCISHVSKKKILIDLTKFNLNYKTENNYVLEEHIL